MNPTNKRTHFLLAILPALVLMIGFWASSLRGPYHYGLNSDPEYPYLFNAVNLLLLDSPGHTDHPGTTLQLLLAAVVGTRHFIVCGFGDCGALQVHVFSNPEAYLRFANLALMFLLAAVVWYAGRYVCRNTQSLWIAVVFQSAVFVFPVVLQSLGRVSPEPLIVILSFAYLAPFVVLAANRSVDADAAPVDHLAEASWTGALFGAAFVTKITCAPLGILLFALPGAKAKVRFLLCALASGLLFVLPVIHKIPAILKWAQSLLMNSGHYGGGAAGLPAGAVLKESALSMFRQEPFYPICLLLALASVVALKAVRKELVLALIGALVVLVVTIKHPGARYLIPGMTLLAFIATLAFAQLRHTKAGVVIFALLALGNIYEIVTAMSKWATGQDWYVSGVAKLSATAKAAGPDCRVFHYYRSNDLTSSLIFGNEYASFKHSNVLRNIYPLALRYNTFAGRFDGFDGADHTDDVIAMLQNGDCVLVQGMSLIESNWPASRGLTKVVLASEAGETLSQVGFKKPPATNFSVAPGSNATIIEAENTKSGNTKTDTSVFGAGIGVLTSPVVPAWAEFEVTLPAAGKYEIRSRFASANARPVRLSVNGKVLLQDYAKDATGGYFAADQKWLSAGEFSLPAGKITIRLDSDGPFPHIDKIAFIPEPPAAGPK